MPGQKSPEPIFRGLTGGPGGRGRLRTERHQRGRLEGAMVEAVGRHGYPETTVGELVALAGVSKSTFYDHFGSKEECFLSTLETIVEIVTASVGIAYRSESGLRERLGAGLARFSEIVAEESAAATLVVVDSLSLGASAVEHRDRSVAAFELMFRQSFEQDPGDVVPSDLEVRAVVAGIRRIVYRCLRSGHPEEIGQYQEQLLEWALLYRNEPVLPPSSASAAESNGHAVVVDGAVPDWEEPPDSPRSRQELTQRERIVRAAAHVAAESGHAALTIPAISARAGTSNQTFYEHFENKEEAFIAAFEELARRAVRVTAAASAGETDWPAAVEKGMRGFLQNIVDDQLFARLAFFELPTAGAAALDRADALSKRFTSFLEPEALPAGVKPLPPVISEAIGGGIWAVIQHEIAGGRLLTLPDMAPEICALALTPLYSR